MTNDQPCHATRQSDEMVCNACRLRWDVNDPERPECRKAPPVMRAATPYHRGGVALPSAPHLVGPGLAGKFASGGIVSNRAPGCGSRPLLQGETVRPRGYMERFVSGLPDREPRN